MTQAARKEFRSRLVALPNRHEKPDPAAVAAMALDSGLSRREALWEIVRLAGSGCVEESEAFDTVAEFIAAMCADGSNEMILELAELPALLTATAFEGRGNSAWHVVSRNVKIAAAFSVLFEDAHVASSLEEFDPSAAFDCIVCQLILGGRLKDLREAVTEVAARLTPDGRMFWLTQRLAPSSARAGQAMAALAEHGLHAVAWLDVPAGAIKGSRIEATLTVVERRAPERRLVGALRDREIVPALADAVRRGPVGKPGAIWEWLDPGDARSFSHLERARHLNRLAPRGRYEPSSLSSLILDAKVEKANAAPSADGTATAHLYVPECATGRVTTDLDEQTVKSRFVYRVPVNAAQANPRFLAMLLNSPYGRGLRSLAARGAVIERISVHSLQELELPLPSLATQDRIARIESDLSLLVFGFEEIKDRLQRDWTDLTEVGEQVDALKAVLDIEQQIKNWWRELPYPLATIYRRYRISEDPKERLDRLLHFFEVAAVYLAAIGASHVKELRSDWEEQFKKWLHPADAAGIERADFGFWTRLAGASLKDLSRISSTPELRDVATEAAGPELAAAAGDLGPLGKTTKTLDAVRRYRNSWKGHGGHVKPSDAERLDEELQQHVRDFYGATSKTFRRLLLVRPGLAEVSDSGHTYQTDILAGSDPAFHRESIELSSPAKSHSLAFWMKDSRTVCRALPFFRTGAPQEPQESGFYVFSRVEDGGFRWISYQDAREQEFVAPDEELQRLIGLQKGDLP